MEWAQDFLGNSNTDSICQAKGGKPRTHSYPWKQTNKQYEEIWYSKNEFIRQVSFLLISTGFVWSPFLDLRGKERNVVVVARRRRYGASERGRAKLAQAVTASTASCAALPAAPCHAARSARLPAAPRPRGRAGGNGLHSLVAALLAAARRAARSDMAVTASTASRAAPRRASPRGPTWR